MKESEVRELGKCALCGEPLLASGMPLFWRVMIDRFVVDLGAVQRQQGLTMMLGGNAALAHVMGPDENMAQPVMERSTVALCEPCGSNVQTTVAALGLRE